MIPNEKEFLGFIKKRDFVNISMIAREFNIKNVTASDLVNDLEKKNLVKVVKFGGSKIIVVR